MALTFSVLRCRLPPLPPRKKTKLGKFKKRNDTDIGEVTRLLQDEHDTLILIEKVTLFARDTDAPGKRFMIQRMMSNYNSFLTIMKIFTPHHIEVAPRTWQAYLNLVLKGESKEDRKRRYARAAQQYYPEIKVRAWNADALCLLQLAQRKIKFEPEWITKSLPKKEEEIMF